MDKEKKKRNLKLLLYAGLVATVVVPCLLYSYIGLWAILVGLGIFLIVSMVVAPYM